MENIRNAMDAVLIMLACSIRRFVKEERGDTNFISILIILAIVIVLAGIFFPFARNAMQTITGNAQNFINSIK